MTAPRTDQQLELRLRAWYRKEVDDPGGAPASLRLSVSAIPDASSPVTRTCGSPRGLALLAAAALLIALAVGGALILGSGIVRRTSALPSPQPTVITTAAPEPSRGPSPTPSGPSASSTPTASPSPTPTAAHTDTATPPPTPAPVPDLVVVYQLRGTSADISTLDVTSGARTAVATVPVDSVQLRSGVGRVEWSVDRTNVMVLRLSDSASVQARVDVANHTVTPVGDVRLGGDTASPDGARLVGVDGDASNGESVVVDDFQGKQLQRISLPAGMVVYGAVGWSPDGTWILISGCQPCNLGGKGPGTSTVAHLSIVPLDGRPIVQVGASASESYGQPRVSPDLATFVMPISCVRKCTAGIGAIDIAGGPIRHLTAKDGDDEPVWSDDGQRIAFVRPAGSGRGIWVMDADGGNLTRLTTAAANYGEHSPVWSPDGTSILFTKGQVGASIGDLWVVPSTGGKARLLVGGATGDW